MIEYEEYKTGLNNLKPQLQELYSAMKTEEARAEIERLEKESAQDGFWSDIERSQKVLQTIKKLKAKCETYDKLAAKWDDLYTLCTMAIEEEDLSVLPELAEEYEAFQRA